MMKNHRVLLRGKNKYFLRPAVLLTGVRSALVLSRRIYSSWGAETDVAAAGTRYAVTSGHSITPSWLKRGYVGLNASRDRGQ